MAGVRNPDTDDWTEARTRELVRLKKAGYSAAQIAKQLTGTTRSAVIAKLHRIGMVKRVHRGAKAPDAADFGDHNAGVRGKARALDLSSAELLAPRRFSWETAPGSA